MNKNRLMALIFASLIAGIAIVGIASAAYLIHEIRSDEDFVDQYCEDHGYEERKWDNDVRKYQCVKFTPTSDGVGFNEELSGYFTYDNIKED